MVWVGHPHRQWIGKHARRLLEGDAMISQGISRLDGIPAPPFTRLSRLWHWSAMAAQTTAQPPATPKLRMKIDAHEFEAEGPSEVVGAQLRTWERLTGLSTRTPAVNLAGPQAAPDPVAAWSQLFAVDADQKLVTLRTNLRGRQRNANAALLLLFGFGTL